MQALLILGLVGLGAQLINSSLGIGYGVTSTSFLLMVGTAPALASATVNLSQVGSQFVSGLAHWRFGNVDWRVVRGIVLTGAAGAFVGALFLASLPTEAAAPLMTVILLCLGSYVLVRFTLWGTPRGRLGRPLPRGFLAPLGLVAGFFNSTGGGGWGPVGATALLATGRLEPRKVVGSLSVAEFAVVVASSLGFVVGLGMAGVNFSWVAAMLLGGVIAAPIAAWLARRIPGRMLGSLVGGLIVFVNVNNVLYLEMLTVRAPTQLAVYGATLLVWAAAVLWTARDHRRSRLEAPEQQPEPVS